jgi:hypothetical protein
VTATTAAAGRRPAAGADGWSGGVRHPAVAGGTVDSPGRASLTERGFVPGRFGGVAVLIGPELAAQLKATRQKQP